MPFARNPLSRLVPGLLVLLLAVSPSARADESAQRLLMDMNEAVQRTSFRGTFVYFHDGQMEAMRLVHRVEGDEARERLLALTGAAREILRDAEGVVCIMPDSQAVMVDRNFPRTPLNTGFPEDLDALDAHYEFLRVGRDRVAGQPCEVVAVRPRDTYRYGYRVWLADPSRLPLRFELLTPEGIPVEQMMFTELEISDRIADEELLPTLDGRTFRHIGDDEGREQEMETHAAMSWEAGWLPPGFSLRHHNRHGMPGRSARVEHMVYSDGLAAVSVYVERAEDPDERLQGLSRMGAVSAMGLSRDGVHVTVVGEVPPVTVQRIAEGMRRR
ncbi:MucB/RseB C-terminal domain-containing protein [Thiohalobacter sp.]|uniref:MucB/RseB C-terminal domain-containing protein n=1 Tax=Thiohalobacter sp. TaxID=2025948 RepID=UPI0026200D92|nr:MucB/RseB C-terminal domain-containing protein [Thiohalobacter sp.]